MGAWWGSGVTVSLIRNLGIREVSFMPADPLSLWYPLIRWLDFSRASMNSGNTDKSLYSAEN
jgi:hypothetical protein